MLLLFPTGAYLPLPLEEVVSTIDRLHTTSHRSTAHRCSMLSQNAYCDQPVEGWWLGYALFKTVSKHPTAVNHNTTSITGSPALLP
jgi:hypothetical protein